MPVLVVAGEDDAKFVDAGQRLASAIGPNAIFVLAPACGHAVPFEQPEAFAALVRAFVAGETGPALGPIRQDGSDHRAIPIASSSPKESWSAPVMPRAAMSSRPEAPLRTRRIGAERRDDRQQGQQGEAPVQPDAEPDGADEGDDEAAGIDARASACRRGGRRASACRRRRRCGGRGGC